MIIQCSSCGTKFKFADNKVTAAGVKLKCSKCKNVFVVKKPPEKPVAKKPPEKPVAKKPSVKKPSAPPQKRPAPGSSASRNCPYCKKSVDANTIFCPHCGEDITRKKQPPESGGVICPECKSPNGPESKFCGKCGKNLSELKQKKQPEIPQEVNCPECGTKNSGEGKFCSTCGGKLPLPPPVVSGGTTTPKMSDDLKKRFESQGLGESQDESGGTIFPFTAGWGDEYSGDTVNREGEDIKLVMTLKVTAGPDEGTEFTITKKNTVIGREDSDINIDDFKTSRHHAEIEVLGNKFLLKDLESTNGTYLNDNLTPADFISHDDEIKIGDTIYQVVIEEERFV